MPTPQQFKQLILQKYPDGVSSDGIPYVQMDALELTKRLVSKYPDGVTSDGIKYQDFLPSTAAKPVKPVTPGVGAESAAVPTTPLKETKSVGGAIKNVLKIIPNAIKDVAMLPVEAVKIPFSIAKRVVYEIPKETLGLVKDSGGVGNAIKNFADSFGPGGVTLMENMGKALQQNLPNVVNQLANTDAIVKLPQELQSLVRESGGYGQAFKYLLQTKPEDFKDVPKQYAEKVLNAGEAFINHPVNEAIGLMFLRSLAERPTQITEPLKEFATKPIESLKTAAQDTVRIATDITNLSKNKYDQFKQAQEFKAEQRRQSEVSLARDNIASAYREIGTNLVKSNKLLQGGKVRNIDQPSILAERGIVPEIVDGKMRTITQADTLHNTIDPYNAVLDRSLVEFKNRFPEKATVTLEELRTKALELAKTDKNINQNIVRDLVKGIDDEISGYNETLGTAVDLERLNGIKRGKWANTKFDFTKPYKASVDYLMGKAAKEIIEQRTKGEVAVQELNDYTAQLYEAEKFLRSLDGRAVKGGRAGKYFARTAGSMIGSVAGSMGGPVGSMISGIAGAYAGDLIQEFMQQSTFSNPLKKHLLDDLKANDPAAYTQIVDWLEQQGKPTP